VYVCMYVCMYVRMYVCMYVRTYVCTYVRTTTPPLVLLPSSFLPPPSSYCAFIPERKIRRACYISFLHFTA